jgi:Ca2+-binding EF-hand superfamily protein
MAAAAAAVAARKRRQRMNTLKAREAQKKLIYDTLVDKWFEKHDTNHSGVLERDQLEQLLMEIEPDASPNSQILQTLMSKAEGRDTTGDGQVDTSGISREKILATVENYREYARQQGYLDVIFKKFDTNGSGKLEKNQLHKLLVQVSPDSEVAEADTEFVLEHCDLDGTNAISRDEVLPAIAKWKELVEEKQKKRGCCFCFSSSKIYT